MTDDTLPMTDERAAFEAYCVRNDLPTERTTVEDCTSYNDWRTEWAWSVWQDLLSIASPAAPHPAQQAGDMVDRVMALVSEYGQCRWSEGGSAATHMDRLGERRKGEEAAHLYAEIRSMLAAAPAIPAQQALCPCGSEPVGCHPRCARRNSEGGAIPAQQAGQPEDAKDAAMAFAVEVLHRVREFVIVHGPDGAWQAACNRCDEAIERLGAAMSSPTAKKGEGA